MEELAIAAPATEFPDRLSADESTYFTGALHILLKIAVTILESNTVSTKKKTAWVAHLDL